MYRVRSTPSSAIEVSGASPNDKVCLVVPVPEGGIIRGVKIRQHVIGTLEERTIWPVLYAVSAYLFPILDPDTSWSPDTVWDQQVPKDDQFAANDIDIDTTGTDTTPDILWGDAKPSLLVGSPGMPTPYYKTAGEISFGNSAKGFVHDGIAADDHAFIPAQTWQRNIGREVRATVHSVLMFAISMGSPTTTATWYTPNDVVQWNNLKYMEETVMDASKIMEGGLVAGTQTDADEAMADLNSFLETSYKEAAASFGPTWIGKFTTVASVIMDVPGWRKAPALSSGQPV